MASRTITLSLLLTALATTPNVQAQCGAGEVEVYIEVNTDNYGNETMWQLVNSGNACDQSPIFTGGNPVIDCDDAGTQGSPNGGYPDNTTITEGPFCLIEGAAYDIISIDSYGDAQASFTVLVNGGYAGVFEGGGGVVTHTFNATPPAERDIALLFSTTGFFCEVDLPVIIAGTVQNMGGLTATSFDVAYSIDGGPEQTATITATLAPGDKYDFLHTTAWTPTAAGSNDLEIRIAGVNGTTDLNASNDVVEAVLTVNPAIPDIMNDYLSAMPTMTEVGNGDDDILVPRDLDFHPDRSRNELWVINKDVFATGGSTVRFFNPGEEDQTFLYQRDPASRHFLSLPTGIAMGDNNNFATSPGVYDANGNQSTPTPFTGPTLWSADPDIYAQNQFGPLGSHLDMLHVTPRSQGIAHERWNRYWVVDGTNQDVVMHDFREDHGPGQDYHGDAIIHRFPEVSITRDPNDHIVSHCVVDKHTGWLYIVDHGGQRVLRLNTQSGTPSTNPSFGPFENYVSYRNMTGATWEVVVDAGLQEPAGIEVIGDHLLVSDHATGEIVIYDMTDNFAEAGRIATGAPGIMGIKVGPDGRIWFVNASQSKLVRVDPASIVGVAERGTASLSLHPNPAADRIFLSASYTAPGQVLEIRDAAGRLCMSSTAQIAASGLDVSSLALGIYTASIPGVGAQRFIVSR